MIPFQGEPPRPKQSSSQLRLSGVSIYVRRIYTCRIHIIHIHIIHIHHHIHRIHVLDTRRPESNKMRGWDMDEPASYNHYDGAEVASSSRIRSYEATTLTSGDSWRPDPRRADSWDNRDSSSLKHAVSAALTDPPIDPKDKRLDFLIRHSNKWFQKDDLYDARRWTQTDSKHLQELVKEYKAAGVASLLRNKARRTALASLKVLITCYLANRVDVQDQASLDRLRADVQDMTTDACEDDEAAIRKEGYQALLALSEMDLSFVEGNCRCLVQLLQHDSPDEAALISEIICKHSFCL